MSLGFLWGPGCVCEVPVSMEGNTPVESKVEQMIWVAVWCEGTKSIAFVQAFQKPGQMSANWKGSRIAAEMGIVSGLERT